MPPLPEIPLALPQVQAPQVHRSSVTPADIQAPFQQLSLTFKEFSQEANTLGRRAAKEAGERAVSQDADGNVTVERLPIFGDAAEDYHRAATVGAVAKVAEISKRDLIKLRGEFASDPESFVGALNAYRDKKIETYNSILGPATARTIGRTIDQTGTMLYRGLANTKRKADLTESRNNIVSQADAYADDLVSLAEADGTGSPEYRERLGDYRALLDEAAGNPLLAYTPELANEHIERTVARAHEAAAVGSVRKAYEAAGPDAARTVAAGVVAHDRWSPEERSLLEERTASAIDSLDADAERKLAEQVRRPLVAQETREQEGFVRLARGGMNQGWIDRYGDTIGLDARESFQRALNAPAVTHSEPGLSADLTRMALDAPFDAARGAVDALGAGQLNRGDFEAVSQLAITAAQDAQERPWANALRRDVLAQQPDALPDVNALLASPQVTRAQAQEQADVLVKQYDVAESRRLAATLPLPRFAPAGRGAIEAKDLDTATARLVSGASAGQVSLAEIASQSGLLAQWRRAVAKEA